MDHPSSTYVTAPVSVIECPRAADVLLTLIPTLHIEKSHFTVHASLELGELSAWITDAVLCIPKFGPMKDCILNGDIQCPYRGCFDTPDIYLDYKVTFLKNSNYTGAITAASNLFNLQFARGYENYNGDRCENVTEVDYMRFSTISLGEKFYNRQAVFDIKYDVPLCHSGRRLSEKSRRLGVVQL
jgi:hypothetical protein